MSTWPSIISTGLRGRVERLMRGDIRSDDLRELFFNMREEAGGRGIASEIANFIAHPGMRTRGITVREVQDFYAYQKFFLGELTRPILTTEVSGAAPDAVRANLRRMRPAILKKETGLNKAQAEQVLERILSRVIRTPGGGIKKLLKMTPQEERVFSCIGRHIKGGPLFDDHQLFEDFCRALLRRNLLSSPEKSLLRKSKAAITMFALVAMHNRVVDLGDGTTAELAITPDRKDRLAIFANAHVVKDRAKLATWIFKTELPISDYCELGVAPLTRALFVGDFEMSPEPKLRRSS